MTTSGVLVELARQCQKDSKRWFPDTSEDLVFMALAIGGEVGEVQGIVKKAARGSLDLKNAKTKHEQAYNMKRVENEQRFGQAAQNGKRS
jgi:hypothetical protein